MLRLTLSRSSSNRPLSLHVRGFGDSHCGSLIHMYMVHEIAVSDCRLSHDGITTTSDNITRRILMYASVSVFIY
jgi:hypothetical protein